MIKCTKAIIPVAGYGTRRLPITKSIEKCMLPVGNRPIIDYVVADCVRAGVTDIYFVISGEAEQLKSYYGQNKQLEQYLETKGKTSELESIQPPKGLSFHYVQQDLNRQRYGTTVPVWLCSEFIEPDEHALVMMGDDFIYNPDGISEGARLIAAAEASQGSAMVGVKMSPEKLSSYGVIAMKDGSREFDYIQEKPKASEAKSQLINVSKYLFEASFFKQLEQSINNTPEGQECVITDPINQYVEQGNSLQVVEASGKYLDGGQLEAWVEANNYVLAHKQE